MAKSRIERTEAIGLAGLGVSIASLGVSLVPYVAPLLNKKPKLRSEGKTLQKQRK